MGTKLTGLLFAIAYRIWNTDGSFRQYPYGPPPWGLEVEAAAALGREDLLPQEPSK